MRSYGPASQLDLLWYTCDYGRLILYIILHSIKLRNALRCTLPNTLWCTLLTAIDCTLPACLTVCSQVSSQDALKHTPEHALKYTPNLTWLYARIYAPGCSTQRLAELQVPGTGWRVAGGGWRVTYGGRNHDVGRYYSLNHIFSAPTATRSHDASWSWCWQLQPWILQERYTIESWGEQISNSDFPAESAACFPRIVGVCVRIRAGADGDDGDGDDGDGDGVDDGDHSTRST